ncbi:MAG: hypothetical protein HHJ09_13505 [Glaciimonas sp.]|nr:hypothetical protein [Glaciimonas sp.]
MKKLLGIAAFILAFSPLAQAQNSGAGLAGHPDARNDRNGASNYSMTPTHSDRMGAKPMHHAKPMHPAKHHPKRHPKHHRRVVSAK